MGTERKNWTVAIANSEADGVTILHVNGTEDMVRQFMLELVESDRLNDDSWDSGTETIDEITLSPMENKLDAYGNYSQYHIDYTAIVDTEPTYL